jgi:hypothetical protein
MFFFSGTGQYSEEPNMIFIATAVDIEIKSFDIQLNWPIIGAAALIIVAAWLVFLFIRKG